jgi:hypothetical protein
LLRENSYFCYHSFCTLKKLLAFLLISIFLYSQVGYFVAFKIRQAEVRREMKRKIKNSVPQNELAVIKVKKSEHLDWVKEGKEFRHKGSLYDIVRFEMQEDLIIYHCVNDVQEQELFARLDEHVNNHIAAHSQQSKHSAKKVTKDYFCEDSPSLPSPAFTIVEFMISRSTPAAGFGSPPVQPPELV